jgi:hypothetical protein
MANRKSSETEKTPQGYEVRVPKRREVMANLKKIAKAPAKGSARGPQK